MENPSIREAVEADLGAINDIYNHYVLHSTCTYQTEPSTLEERRKWFSEHTAPYTVIVAEVGGQVVGWGSLSRFHPRAAYGRTTENSVYIHPDWHRRGLGRALLARLVVHARKAGFHTIIAIVSADQEPSVKLHEAFGFTPSGRVKEVGNKFGRWLDVAYLQLML